MAKVSVSNLSSGSELLNDAESFLTDMSDTELQISGGGGFGGGDFGGGGFPDGGFGGFPNRGFPDRDVFFDGRGNVNIGIFDFPFGRRRFDRRFC
jgi:hypothetical protein